MINFIMQLKPETSQAPWKLCIKNEKNVRNLAPHPIKNNIRRHPNI